MMKGSLFFLLKNQKDFRFDLLLYISLLVLSTYLDHEDDDHDFLPEKTRLMREESLPDERMRGRQSE